MLFLTHICYIFSAINNNMLSANKIWKIFDFTQEITTIVNEYLSFINPVDYAIFNNPENNQLNLYNTKLQPLISEINNFNEKIPKMKFKQPLSNKDLFLNLIEKVKLCHKQTKNVLKQKYKKKNKKELTHNKDTNKTLILHLEEIKKMMKYILNNISIKENTIYSKSKPPLIILTVIYNHLKIYPRYTVFSAESDTQITDLLLLIREILNSIKMINRKNDTYKDLTVDLKVSKYKEITKQLKTIRSLFDNTINSFRTIGNNLDKTKKCFLNFDKYYSLLININLIFIPSNNLLNFQESEFSENCVKLPRNEFYSLKNFLHDFYTNITDIYNFVSKNSENEILNGNETMQYYYNLSISLIYMISGYEIFYENLFFENNNYVNLDKKEAMEVFLHLNFLSEQLYEFKILFSVIFHNIIKKNKNPEIFKQYIILYGEFDKKRINVKKMVRNIIQKIKY
ncbi:hypothetical protein DMUE_0251 [Dictyocoela muelleri]|nr:hypothetical protein DMUE_0251 [Dictyocoela muelleri]